MEWAVGEGPDDALVHSCTHSGTLSLTPLAYRADGPTAQLSTFRLPVATPPAPRDPQIEQLG
eukprot:10523503-Alexandrium_andersonii.AAC.1